MRRRDGAGATEAAASTNRCCGVLTEMLRGGALCGAGEPRATDTRRSTSALGLTRSRQHPAPPRTRCDSAMRSRAPTPPHRAGSRAVGPAVMESDIECRNRAAALSAGWPIAGSPHRASSRPGGIHFVSRLLVVGRGFVVAESCIHQRLQECGRQGAFVRELDEAFACFEAGGVDCVLLGGEELR